MLAVKVLPPAVHLRVTENIPQIVAFIEGIIRNEHAYATKQGMCISVSGPSGSVTASLWVLEMQLVSLGTQRNGTAGMLPCSKPQEPSWKSPWGKRRPGCHIECSTIARTS